MSYSSWEEFFTSLSDFSQIAYTLQHASRVDVIEHAVLRFDCDLRVLSAIKATLEAANPENLSSGMRQSIDDLILYIQQIRSTLNSVIEGMSIEGSFSAINVSYEASTGCRGHPRLSVSRHHVYGLRELGFSWTKISRILGISRRTLYSRRVEMGIYGDGDPFILSERTCV